MTSVAEVLGQVGLPMPIQELAARRWEVIVVGGGHNGLTTAAYCARAGRRTLVLERRERLGGACTLERPFPHPDYLISPCAYLVGLLHPVVIEELGLVRRGVRVLACEPSQWSPFLDGSSFTEWKDPARTAESLRRLSPGDVDGYAAYQDVYRQIRARLRSADPALDTWVGEAPGRDQLEARLAGDPEAIEVVFELSIAELVERYVADDRIRAALHGAGVIGTWAGPRDPGTAGVRLLHNLGLLDGWGFVEGGMGRISFALADAAREAGAVLACGVPVGAIEPGVGITTEDGTRIRASVVVSNADPHRTLALLPPADVPGDWRARVEAWDVRSPVLKLNCGLRRLPRFLAAPGGAEGDAVYRAMVVLSTGVDDTQAAFAAACRGEVAPQWCELYFQTAHDPSVAPPGRHVMSVFAQYAPYQLAAGDWEGRRREVVGQLLARIGLWAPDVADCVEHWELLAPPDVEARIGLTGGHIFQGSCLPGQMWDRRMPARTPIESLYLCGAATHPGGSVIGVNGRNAAMAVLTDLEGDRVRG